MICICTEVLTQTHACLLIWPDGLTSRDPLELISHCCEYTQYRNFCWGHKSSPCVMQNNITVIIDAIILINYTEWCSQQTAHVLWTLQFWIWHDIASSVMGPDVDEQMHSYVPHRSMFHILHVWPDATHTLHLGLIGHSHTGLELLSKCVAKRNN